MRGLFTQWINIPDGKGIRVQLHLDADFDDTNEVRKLYHEADEILCKLLKLNKDASSTEENKDKASK